MLLESLARLTLVNEECKERGIVIGSEEFMKDTESIIEHQIAALQKDLQFQTEEPGPYNFGLNNRSIVIFPPTFTENGDWVLIIFNDTTQIKEQIFVFQTIYGLIENLIKAFKYIENVENRKEGEGTPEAGSVQTDSSSDIDA